MLISVIVISYNQEKFIDEALRSIVNQKTKHDLEVIIGDDLSTDNTRKIIKDYQKRYPDIIKPIFNKTNLGPLQNFYNALAHTSGDYIAICEGDDYWTDENKLELQATFLSQHKQYALCFHPVEVIYESGAKQSYLFPSSNKRSDFSLKELLKKNFIQTNSALYRRTEYRNLLPDIMPGDWYFHVYHAQFGKIGFIDKPMAVYRKHEAGIWWESSNDKNIIWEKYGLQHLKLFMEFFRMFEHDSTLRDINMISIGGMLNNIANVRGVKNRPLLIESVLAQYTDVTFLIDCMHKFATDLEQKFNEEKQVSIQRKEGLIALSEKNDQKQQAIERRDEKIKSLDEKIKSLEAEITSIRDSFQYKVYAKISGIKKSGGKK